MNISPEELIELVGIDKTTFPVYIKMNTLDKLLTFEVPEDIFTEWFLNFVDFDCGMEVYILLYFDGDSAFNLAKFCVRSYPETIKNII